MSYGIEIFNGSGVKILTSDGRYGRLVYTGVVSNSGSITLPVLDGKLSYQWVQDNGAIGIEYMIRYDRNINLTSVISRSGNTITWNRAHIVNGILFVFIYS
jgi:hypothetical protein